MHHYVPGASQYGHYCLLCLWVPALHYFINSGSGSLALGHEKCVFLGIEAFEDTWTKPVVWGVPSGASAVKRAIKITACKYEV